MSTNKVEEVEMQVRERSSLIDDPKQG